MSFWLFMPAMGAGESEKVIFDLIGVAAFRANRLAKTPRGWQHIRKIIDQAADDEAQKYVDN